MSSSRRLPPDRLAPSGPALETYSERRSPAQPPRDIKFCEATLAGLGWPAAARLGRVARARRRRRGLRGLRGLGGDKGGQSPLIRVAGPRKEWPAWLPCDDDRKSPPAPTWSRPGGPRWAVTSSLLPGGSGTHSTRKAAGRCRRSGRLEIASQRRPESKQPHFPNFTFIRWWVPSSPPSPRPARCLRNCGEFVSAET